MATLLNCRLFMNVPGRGAPHALCLCGDFKDLILMQFETNRTGASTKYNRSVLFSTARND